MNPLVTAAADEHRFEVQRVADGRRQVDLLMLGDSLTDLWLHPSTGRRAFREAFGRYHTAVFGYGGEDAKDILGHLGKLPLSAIRPRVVVLCAGANQLAREIPVDTTAWDVLTLAFQMWTVWPAAHFHLCGLLPQDPGWGWDVDAKVRAINAKLGAGNWPPMVRFRDHGAALRTRFGGLDPLCFTDGVHLTTEGYRRWAASLVMDLAPFLPPPYKGAHGPTWRSLVRHLRLTLAQKVSHAA